MRESLSLEEGTQELEIASKELSKRRVLKNYGEVIWLILLDISLLRL
jgi:hypothetical protein